MKKKKVSTRATEPLHLVLQGRKGFEFEFESNYDIQLDCFFFVLESSFCLNCTSPQHHGYIVQASKRFFKNVVPVLQRIILKISFSRNSPSRRAYDNSFLIFQGFLPGVIGTIHGALQFMLYNRFKDDRLRRLGLPPDQILVPLIIFFFVKCHTWTSFVLLKALLLSEWRHPTPGYASGF